MIFFSNFLTTGTAITIFHRQNTWTVTRVVLLAYYSMNTYLSWSAPSEIKKAVVQYMYIYIFYNALKFLKYTSSQKNHIQGNLKIIIK